MICWPGIEGYNYPFQTPYARGLGVVHRRDGRGGRGLREHGVKLFLEHKNSEPAMKILMRNIGMTLHVIHTLRARGITNVQVNMDWQHLIMNGESLGEYAAMLAAEGLLGHQHANSGWGTFDDDNMVGATAFMETLELALELRRAGLRRQRRAARLRPLSVHRGRRRRREALGAAVAVHRRGGRRRSTTPRCARRRAARTPSAPTRSSTPRSVRDTSHGDARGADRRELVAIDSTNPDLVAGGAGEAEIAAFVADWLAEAGLEVELHEAAPGRPNVVGVARGTGGGRSLLLNAHMDTVGVAGMEAPFAPVVQDGRLHGRGAGDMKGSLAAMMLVGAAAVREGFRGDVIVTAVADEEVGSVGTEALVRRTTADAAIVTEPTEEVVAIAHKGFVAFEIETEGVAAHGSRPDLGIDAIAAMGPVLSGIAALDARLRVGHGASAARDGLGPRLRDRGRAGVLELSGRAAACRASGARSPARRSTDVRAELEALAAGHRRDRAARRSTASRSRRRPTRRSCGAAPPSRPRGRRRGRVLGRLRAPRRRGDPDRRLRAVVGGHPRRRRVGRSRLARALPRRVPRRRAGAVRVRRCAAVHVGVGLWGRSWAELIAAAPGLPPRRGRRRRRRRRAPGRRSSSACPTFRDLGRALRGDASRRRRARLAALDAPAAGRAGARARAAT